MHFIQTPLGETVIPEVNRSAFDRIGSYALFKRQFGDRLRQPDTLYLIIGTDSGLLPRWIAKQGKISGSRYLFIEPDELVDLIATQYGELFDDQDRVLAAASSWKDLQEHMRFSDYAYLDRIEVVSSIGATDGYWPAYRPLEQSITHYLEACIRDVQLQLGNFVFLQRQIENLADNVLPALRLRDRFREQQAILLAGGPSLDEILPWLKQYRDRYLLLAVSRVCRQLLANDLVPDIVFSIDPTSASFDISKEGLLFPPETLLVCGNHTVPTLQAQWPGPVLYCGDRYPWPTEREPENLSMAGPTVTNLALHSAIQMGFARVILGGVDLCYDRWGNTHANGSNEHRAGPFLSHADKRVETNGGWLSDTDFAFAQAIETIEKLASDAATRGVELINPAPGAARMQGVRFVPLEEIPVPEQPASRAALQQELTGERYEQECMTRLQDTLRELAWARNQVTRIDSLCAKAREYNRRLHNPDDPNRYRFKLRMDKIERRLDHDHSRLSGIVRQFAVAPLLRLGRVDPDHEWTDAELQTWGDDYYRIYGQAARQVMQLLDTARETTKLRLAEFEETPDLPRLIREWSKRQIPGRVRSLLHRRPRLFATLEANLQDEIQALQRQLIQTVENPDTRHAARIKQRYDISQARARLENLFRNAQSSELDDLAQALARLDDPIARELHSLARGYQAELDGMTQEALRHYQEIVDQAASEPEDDGAIAPNPRLEDALRRMSAITLERGDGGNALLILDALSSLSPAYLPQYAELLRIQGRIQEAADVYTEYLKMAPGDLSTLLKLGKLFQDAGAIESARWAYDHVLAQSPDNQAALRMRESLNQGGTPA